MEIVIKKPCAMCGTSLEITEESDAKANKEAEKIWGKPVDTWKQESAIVCDDCYKKIHPDNHPEKVAEAKKQL